MGERERGNSYEHVLHLHFILLLFTIITDEEINPDLGWQEAGKAHNIGRTQCALGNAKQTGEADIRIALLGA